MASVRVSVWADSLSSTLHSSTPWRRQGPPESVTAFAERVLSYLGQGIEVGDSSAADEAVRAGIGKRDGGTFTGYPDEAAVWAQLAGGEFTLDELTPGPE